MLRVDYPLKEVRYAPTLVASPLPAPAFRAEVTAASRVPRKTGSKSAYIQKILHLVSALSHSGSGQKASS